MGTLLCGSVDVCVCVCVCVCLGSFVGWVEGSGRPEKEALLI